MKIQGRLEPSRRPHRELELPLAVLDPDFKSRDGRDEDLPAMLADVRPRRVGELRLIPHQPEESAGIEEDHLPLALRPIFRIERGHRVFMKLDLRQLGMNPQRIRSRRERA